MATITRPMRATRAALEDGFTRRRVEATDRWIVFQQPSNGLDALRWIVGPAEHGVYISLHPTPVRWRSFATLAAAGDWARQEAKRLATLARNQENHR